MTMKITNRQMQELSPDSIETCPLNWIDLEYLYPDGSPVAGARYVVRSASRSFESTGLLDGKGYAHIELPHNINRIVYTFEKDPEIIELKIKPKPHGETVEEGWIDGFLSGLNASWEATKTVAKWIWGAIQGDFNDDQSFGQIVFNTVLTMIPVVDQVGDIRDLVANLKALIWDKKYDDYSVWVALVFTVIGLVPEFGSLFKGILKAIWKGAKSIDWEELLKLFNYFAKGNGSKWLTKLRESGLDELASKVVAKTKELLNGLKTNLKSIKARLPSVLSELGKKIDESLNAVDEVLKRVDQMVKKIFDDIKAKFDEILKTRKTIENAGSSKTMNTKQQEIQSPDQKTAKERYEEQKLAANKAARKKKLHEKMNSKKATESYDQLSPKDKDWIEEDPTGKRKELAFDPDSSTYRVNEARAAAQAEANGSLKGLERDIDPSTGTSNGGDFIDTDGKHWDHVDAQKSGVDGVMGKAQGVGTKKGENVLVDCGNMSDAEKEALKKSVDAQKTSTTGDIVFVP